MAASRHASAAASLLQQSPGRAVRGGVAAQSLAAAHPLKAVRPRPARSEQTRSGRPSVTPRALARSDRHQGRPSDEARRKLTTPATGETLDLTVAGEHTLVPEDLEERLELSEQQGKLP